MGKALRGKTGSERFPLPPPRSAAGARDPMIPVFFRAADIQGQIYAGKISCENTRGGASMYAEGNYLSFFTSKDRNDLRKET